MKTMQQKIKYCIAGPAPQNGMCLMSSTIARLSCLFFFSSRRRHTRLQGDWSSDVCSSDLRDRDREHRRVYDRDHHDYHDWDDREDSAYRHWREERHEAYVDYNRLKRRQQREYWRWRHEHMEHEEHEHH